VREPTDRVAVLNVWFRDRLKTKIIRSGGDGVERVAYGAGHSCTSLYRISCT
jgi:hypothetical protein